jgi:hypothetical protein
VQRRIVHGSRLGHGADLEGAEGPMEFVEG